MELLKKYLEPLKKHYEKVLLGVVLLGLLVAVVLLPVILSQERKKLEDIRTVEIQPDAQAAAPAGHEHQRGRPPARRHRRPV